MLLLITTVLAGPVDWETLNEVAAEAWTTGPGLAARARTDGARQASRRVGFGPELLDVQAQVGEPTQRQLLVAAHLPLASGVAERRYRSVVAEVARQDEALARLAFLSEAQEAWRDWWVAAELHAHLLHWTERVEADLAAFETAVERGLLAPLALEDLRAESLQVRAEAVAMEQEQRIAASRLVALLGEVDLQVGDHPFHGPLPSSGNPWESLVGRAGELPAVRRHLQQAESGRRLARSLAAERLPTLSGGPMWAPDDTGALRPFAYIGLSVPLQPGVGADQRLARGEAAAAMAEARWLAQRWEAALETERIAWEAARERSRRLDAEVVEPLARRLARLEQAFADGLVTADRVVRARRDHHEIEHEQVRIAAELLASAQRAQALADVLEENR